MRLYVDNKSLHSPLAYSIKDVLCKYREFYLPTNPKVEYPIQEMLQSQYIVEPLMYTGQLRVRQPKSKNNFNTGYSNTLWGSWLINPYTGYVIKSTPLNVKIFNYLYSIPQYLDKQPYMKSDYINCRFLSRLFNYYSHEDLVNKFVTNNNYEFARYELYQNNSHIRNINILYNKSERPLLKQLNTIITSKEFVKSLKMYFHCKGIVINPEDNLDLLEGKHETKRIIKSVKPIGTANKWVEMSTNSSVYNINTSLHKIIDNLLVLLAVYPNVKSLASHVSIEEQFTVETDLCNLKRKLLIKDDKKEHSHVLNGVKCVYCSNKSALDKYKNKLLSISNTLFCEESMCSVSNTAHIYNITLHEDMSKDNTKTILLDLPNVDNNTSKALLDLINSILYPVDSSIINEYLMLSITNSNSSTQSTAYVLNIDDLLTFMQDRALAYSQYIHNANTTDEPNVAKALMLYIVQILEVRDRIESLLNRN